ISDEVIQPAPIVCKGVELFDGNAAFVFNDTLQAAVNVTHAEDKPASKFVLEAGNIFVGIFHADSWLELLTAAEADGHGVPDAAGGRIEQSGRTWFEHVCVVGVAAGIRQNAGSSGWCPCRAPSSFWRGSPIRAQHIILSAESSDSRVKRQNERIAAIIGIELGLAVALGIEDKANPRRPHVIEKFIKLIADQTLLFPA